MANEENRSVNEVVLNGTTIISTREDSVAEDNLVMDETATNKAGEKIKGELDVASADETYNINDPVDDIADEDYIPFNDVSDSEMPKKKTLFTNLIEKLTKYFLPASSIGGKSQLKFNDSGVLDLQLNDIDASKTNNNVTSIHYPTTSNVLDKARRIIMRTEAVVNPDGNIGWKAYVRNYNTSGENVGQKGIQFHMNKSGNLSYQISDARAFREAIGTMDVIGTSLPSGTVIDDYHTSSHTGVYYFADDGVAGNITTLPEAVCGKLIVANNGNGGFSQYYIPNHSVKLWVRVWWNNTWSAWENVAKEHSYEPAIRYITGTADLNDYTEAGIYQCDRTKVTSLANCPVTSSFKLIVDKAYNNSSSEITQRITCQNATETVDWFRTRQYNQSTWGEWVHLPYIKDKTWGNNSGVETMFRGKSDKRGLIQFNNVTDHLVHNYNNGSAWGSEKTLANQDDISPSAIGLGYALATISGSAITATITDFKLRAGVIVSIKINSEMSTACTLNINNTGAKNIKFWNDENPSFGKFIGGGNIVTFIYDGTYYRVISQDRTPKIGVQSYVADTSGNILIDWGYQTNRAQLKYYIASNKLKWNYYKNSAWRGDLTVADYDDIVHQTLGVTIPDNSDLNSYTTNGIYNIGSTNKAKTITNIPVQLAGKLIVQRVAANQYIRQLFITYDNIATMDSRGFYERSYNGDSGGGWRSWRKFIESQDNIICNSTNPLADLYTNKINGQDVINASNGIITNKDITTAVTSLDNIPLNTAGTIVLDASISPTGFQITFAYICYGNNKGKTIEVTRYNHSAKDTEEFWKQSWGDTTGWTGWMPLSRQGTYVGTCATAADQRAKEATVDADFSLKKGVRVAIKFSNTNTYSNATANPITLNVNGTGAKNIWYNTTHSGAGNTGTCSWVYGVANRYLYYVYDGTYWIWETCGEAMNSTNFLRNDASSTLTASDSAYLNVKSSNIDLTQANNGVENTKYPAYIIQDKNGRDMTRLETVVETNGQIRTFLQVGNYNTTSASHFRAGITMYTNKSQDMWYGLNNPHYFHRELGFGYGTCSTAADQRVKVVSMARFRLVVGGIIGVKFSNTNTYSATADNKICLNVNGTGEKPIYYGTGYPTGTHTTAFGYANKVHYYMYDGTNWVWLNHSQDNDGNNRKSFYGTCATAADQQIKVVSLADTNGWELRAGTIVGVRFSNTNTFDSQTSTPIQLNVNNTGAKNIWYNTTHSGAGNTGSNNTIYGVANRVTYFMYDGTYWVWMNYGTEADTTDPRYLGFGYGTCDTAEATTAKVVTLGSYTLRTGGYVTVKFTYAVPANATMNINSKGAKNIWYRGANITANVIKAGDLATFIYDGTRYQLVGIDRDNNLSINYAYNNSAGRPNYITFDDSDVLVTQLNYVVLGDIVTVSMNLKLNVAKTYSENTKIIHGFVPPKQNVFCESQGKLFYLVGNSGDFYVRNTSFTAGQTLWGLNFTYIKA